MEAIGGIVDMRLRPRWLHPFFGSTPGTAEYRTVRWLNRRVGSRDVDHFAAAGDLPGLLAEMDRAGIEVGVMVGRSTPSVRIENDTLAALAERSAGRLVGIASVDPVDLGPGAALVEVRRAVRGLGLRGVNFDAGFYRTPLRADDDLLMPLYEECRRLGVPAFVMSGPTTPDLACNDPLAVDTVARTFPDLPIVCCHGFYPRVAEILAVAFRHENVLVSPDMYLFCPGGRLYVEAANGFLQDQCLFGTSYPFRAMAQSVADLQALGLSKPALAKVAGATARRLLGLGMP
jgi:predicted TIM-barrel fold metal-dependent hydrolase